MKPLDHRDLDTMQLITGSPLGHFTGLEVKWLCIYVNLLPTDSVNDKVLVYSQMFMFIIHVSWGKYKKEIKLC